jgi:DNA-binding MarR family transcriptional regulator
MKTDMLTQKQREIWANYQQMHIRLTGRINRELAQQTGLSEADFGILNALIQSNDDSVRALALRCGLEWEKSRLSHQLRRMEQRGLVVREECIEDNRGTIIRITPHGRELAIKAQQYYDNAIMQYMMSHLSPEQLQTLEAITETVLAQLPHQH